VGDFDGDGLPDVFQAQCLGGTGSAGKLAAWHRQISIENQSVILVIGNGDKGGERCGQVGSHGVSRRVWSETLGGAPGPGELPGICVLCGVATPHGA
ncbi:MAG TPA: hypothetical protein PL065_23635, partial [Polyangiaceae bacterium]|nr:hypothetical protein [Polyangiaceae bacterium]